MSCPGCPEVCTSQQALTRHLRERHPGEALYQCRFCPVLRTTHNNRLKHERVECTRNPQNPQRFTVTPEAVSVSVERVRFTGSRWTQLESLKELVRGETWAIWAQRYEDLRGTADDPLSPDTAAEVVRVVELARAASIELTWDDWDTLEDALGLWDLSSVSRKTASTYFRKLSWYSKFLYCEGHATAQTVSGLERWSRLEGHEAHHEQQSELSLALLDPDKLIELRNRIVEALNRKMTEYDAELATFFRERPEQKKWETWGLKFRCFVELLLRYTGIPWRVQASQSLYCAELDDNPEARPARQVCRLTRRRGTYYRIMDFDKVGKTHMPLSIPVDDITNLYLFFYLKYCRPPVRNGWVFVGAKGGFWHDISADLNRYIKEDLGIDSELYCTRNFIHGSRMIGLACFGAQVNFDLDKMHRHAELMRHSFATMNRFYTTWASFYRARLAHQEFVAAMAPERYSGLALLPTPFLVPVQTPHPLVRSVLETEIVRDYQLKAEPDAVVAVPQTLFHDPREPLPFCSICAKPWTILFPLVNKRHAMKDHYRALCRDCGESAGIKYLPLGYEPAGPVKNRLKRQRDKPTQKRKVLSSDGAVHGMCQRSSDYQPYGEHGLALSPKAEPGAGNPTGLAPARPIPGGGFPRILCSPLSGLDQPRHVGTLEHSAPPG